MKVENNLIEIHFQLADKIIKDLDPWFDWLGIVDYFHEFMTVI